MKKTAPAALALFASTTCLAATPWQKIIHPAAGSTQSIGAFSNGCTVSTDTLPTQSEHYQVMHTDQCRYFGHLNLVRFIQRLNNRANSQGLDTMLIGDMDMSTDGRFNGGHASHQTGLDVDIFLQLPKTRWAQSQLLRSQASNLVSQDDKRVVPSLWKPEILSLIRLAAEGSEVTRTSVNPAIKR